MHPLASLRDAVHKLRRSGASYADVRHIEDEREHLSVRDQRVERLYRASSEGYGVRVVVDGAWGFAARRGADPAALEAACTEALAVARAASALSRAGAGAGVQLASEEPQTGHYATP